MSIRLGVTSALVATIVGLGGLMLLGVSLRGRVGEEGSRLSAGRELMAPMSSGMVAADVLTLEAGVKMGDETEFSPVRVVTRWSAPTHGTARVVTSTIGTPGERSVVRTVVSGTWFALDRRNEAGVVSEQMIEDYAIDVPEVFESKEPVTRLTTLDTLVGGFHSPVNVLDLNALVATGVVTEEASAELLGRQVRTFFVPRFSATNQGLDTRVWVEAATGHILQWERISDGENQDAYHEMWAAVEFVNNVQVPESVFDFTRVESTWRRDVRAKEFDNGAQGFPSQAYSTSWPVTSTIGGGLIVGPTVFISSTDSEYLGGPLIDGWATTQDVKASGYSIATVVQGIDSIGTVAREFGPYWPAWWSNPDPSLMPGSYYTGTTAITLSGGIEAASYELRDATTLEPGRRLPAFKYLVTWIDVTGVRVVFGGNASIASRKGMHGVVNAWLDAR